MKFAEYLNESRSNRLDCMNESVSLKAGDCATYEDQYGDDVGLLVVGTLTHGCVATTGDMIGMYNPKSVGKFTVKDLDTCVYIDDKGKVEGKYPVSKFNGSFDAFMNHLES